MFDAKERLGENGAQGKIIAAAGELVAKKGIESTSLADIASKAGISKESLCHYYASKNELLFDLAEQHVIRISDQLLAWIEDVKQEDAPEKIFQVVFDKIVSADARGKLHLYLVREAIADDESLKARFREKYQGWMKIIEGTLAKFLHAETDFRVFAQIILASLDGFVIQSLLGVEGISSEEIAGFVLGGC